MKLTKADHSYMSVCELDAVDMLTADLIAAMRYETDLIHHRQEYCSRAVHQSYLRLAA